MSRALTDVFRQAEADLGGGRYAEALRGYASVVVGAPSFTRARFRVADALLNLSDRARAKDVYKNLAWHYIKAGHPLLGLVCCKMVMVLDPSFDDALHILAELYSSESDRVGDVEAPELPSLPEGQPAPSLPELDLPSLSELARKLASDTEAIAATPARLPGIPLFSHLGEEAIVRVLGSLKLRRFAKGEKVIREGSSGDSFFMLADGSVAVSKTLEGRETVLAQLRQGSVFGEMALVSKAPRAATVTAMEDVDLLELSRSDLEQHAGELESVRQALKKFTRGRFLANLAATSPLFRPLPRNERRELMAKFKSRLVYPGDIVIEEGQPGRGLFLVLRGAFRVTHKEENAATIDIAELKGGDVFGEISLLKGTPTTATVVSSAHGELLVLAKEDFAEMLARYPELKRTLDEVSDERLRDLKNRVTGEIATDDSRVLV